jgi:hypothetical protein
MFATSIQRELARQSAMRASGWAQAYGWRQPFPPGYIDPAIKRASEYVASLHTPEHAAAQKAFVEAMKAREAALIEEERNHGRNQRGLPILQPDDPGSQTSMGGFVMLPGFTVGVTAMSHTIHSLLAHPVSPSMVVGAATAVGLSKALSAFTQSNKAALQDAIHKNKEGVGGIIREVAKASRGGKFRDTYAISPAASNALHMFAGALNVAREEARAYSNYVKGDMTDQEMRALAAWGIRDRMLQALRTSPHGVPIFRVLNTLYPNVRADGTVDLSKPSAKMLDVIKSYPGWQQDKSGPMAGVFRANSVAAINHLFSDDMQKLWNDPDTEQDPELQQSQYRIRAAQARWMGYEMGKGTRVVDPASPQGGVMLKRMQSTGFTDWDLSSFFTPLVSYSPTWNKDLLPRTDITPRATVGAIEAEFAGFNRPYSTNLDDSFQWAYYEASRTAAEHVLYYRLANMNINPTTPLLIRAEDLNGKLPPHGYVPVETERIYRQDNTYDIYHAYVPRPIRDDILKLHGQVNVNKGLGFVNAIHRVQIGASFTAPVGFSKHMSRLIGFVARQPYVVLNEMARENGKTLMTFDPAMSMEEHSRQNTAAFSMNVARGVARAIDTVFDKTTGMVPIRPGSKRNLQGRLLPAERTLTATPAEDVRKMLDDAIDKLIIKHPPGTVVPSMPGALGYIGQVGDSFWQVNADALLDLAKRLPQRPQRMIVNVLHDELDAMRDRQTAAMLYEQIKNGWMEKVARISRMSWIPGVGAKVAAVMNVVNVDMDDPVNRRIATMLTRDNAAKSNPWEDVWESHNKISTSTHGMLFGTPSGKGMSGMDMRTRVLLARLYMASTGQYDPKGIRDYVNNIGQYTAAADDIILHLASASPFVRTTLPFLSNEMKGLLTGDFGMNLKGKTSTTRRARAKGKVWWDMIASVGVFASLLNYAVSGHMPWENAAGHQLELQVGHNRYVPLVWLTDPGTMRALDTLGLPEAYNAVQSGKSATAGLQGPAQVASQVFLPPAVYPFERGAEISKYGGKKVAPTVASGLVGAINPYAGQAAQLGMAMHFARNDSDRAWAIMNALGGITVGLQAYAPTPHGGSGLDPGKEIERRLDAALRTPKL